MKKGSTLAAVSTAAAIGFYLVSAVIAGGALGRWLDSAWGMAPWGTVGGVILGMMAGLWSTYKKVLGLK